MRKSQIANCAGGRAELSRDELALLDALWGGKTQREAAELVGVSRRTAQYWVKRPAFREEWEARKAARWREIQESLRPKPSKESEALGRRVTGLGWRWSQRIHAANGIVGEALRVATRDMRKERKRVMREVAALVRERGEPRSGSLE